MTALGEHDPAAAGAAPPPLAFDRLGAGRRRRPRRLPDGAESVVLPGCGHLPMWDDPALVAELVLRASGT